MSHRFDPARIERLTAPDRADWLRADQVLEALSIGPEMVVLDFGAGPGFFSLPIARRLSPTGRLVSADVEPEMLQALLRRASAAGTDNIWPVLCNDQSVPLTDRSIDRVLLCLVLHELENGHTLLNEIARVLRPAGRLVIVEWQPWQTERGPAIEERVTPEEVCLRLEAAGLSPDGFSALGIHCYIQTAIKA